MDPENTNHPGDQSAPDEFQQAWQSQSSESRVTLDAQLLLSMLQESQQSFRAVVRWSDSIVVGISLLLLPVWVYLGVKTDSPWTWYLTMPVFVWWAGFTLVYRMRNTGKASPSDGPLLQCVRESLADVESQIWYLRNVVWWNLLPLAVPLLIHALYSAWLYSDGGLDFFSHLPVVCIFLATFYLVYRAHKGTEMQNEPRRQELLALVDTLEDESAEHFPATAPSVANERSHEGGRWWIVTAAACLLAVVTFGCLVAAVLPTWSFDSGYDQPAKSAGAAGEWLANRVTEERQEKNLVGLAAMVTVDGQIQATAAQGERKLGSEVSLGTGDRWHLGGISKAITATMIGRLIESGQMDWSDTLGDCFPDATMHEAWKPVTLKQLLTDTAGVLANFPIEVRRQTPKPGPERTAARRAAVLDVIAQKPIHTPGEKYAYSNVGYTIVGAMAEQVTGLNWEELVNREVFEPLALAGAGFGPPKSSAELLEQPRGHRTLFGGKAAVDDQADNTPIMGPAATVHMTLEDLCTFGNAHLRGQLGEGADGPLLSTETWQQLHLPALKRYACGWVKKEPTYDVPYVTYWHNGSNTMWYALVVFIPEKNMVVAVGSNDGDWKQAEASAWKIVNASAIHFQAEGDLESRKSLPTEAFPKKSPFAAVRWQEAQPEVQVEGQWYKLLSLNDVPATEIVAFSKETYDSKWQKRFEEDLIELLTRMGHSVDDSVKLKVQSSESAEARTLENVPMTRANRNAIKERSMARE